MYSYYALYRSKERTTPFGIFVMDHPQGHAMLWDHEAKAWMYDPEIVGRYFEDHGEDRYQEVDRETAERITPAVTGGEGLPDEETIAWIFSWEGRPPQG